MPNNYFQFKEFTIYQDKCAMKVGTDGVLLGAWVDVAGANSILDIGTGTGLLALMLAQRNQNSIIMAIEIEKQATVQANENFNKSKWANRLSVINISFQEFYKYYQKKYNLIVSNPPYFINSKKAPNIKRSLARHTDQLPFNELFYGVTKLLEDEGRFCIIIPESISKEVILEAEINKLHCNRILNILPKPNHEIKRKIIEFTVSGRGINFSELIIEKGHRHDYTDAYMNLTRDFYLNF